MLQTAFQKDLLLALLGLRTAGLLQAVVKPTLLTASLFGGPLLQLLLASKTQRGAVSPLQTLRNLLIAPVTEEFCFRACMSPLFLLQVSSSCDQPAHILFLLALTHAVTAQHLAARLMNASDAVSIADTILRHTLVLLGHCNSCLVQEWQPN